MPNTAFLVMYSLPISSKALYTCVACCPHSDKEGSRNTHYKHQEGPGHLTAPEFGGIYFEDMPKPVSIGRGVGRTLTNRANSDKDVLDINPLLRDKALGMQQPRKRKEMQNSRDETRGEAREKNQSLSISRSVTIGR